MNPQTLKLLGMGLSLAISLAKLGLDYLADKRLDMRIDTKISKALENFND